MSDLLTDEAQEYLADADECRGYYDRPVGETVAKLCAALGLDPDACRRDGDTWTVRRPPTCLETRAMEKLLPPLHGEGQTPQASGWGALDEAPIRPSP